MAPVRFTPSSMRSEFIRLHIARRMTTMEATVQEDWDGHECDEVLPLLFESVSLYSKIRDAFVGVIESSRHVDLEYTAFAGSQMHFFSSRIQSLTMLLQQWRLWDADILLRSAIECATNFLYISTRTAADRSQCMRELNDDLPEVHFVERSEKARGAARHAPDPDDVLIFRGAALTPEREIELRGRWPKAKRKALKQKWAFSELVPELERVKETTLDLSAYGALRYTYALGSHFVHADRTAIALLRDRSERSSEERALMERAHFARLAVEPTALFCLCLRGMRHALCIPSDTPDLGQQVMALYDQAKKYHRDFSESQDNFYASTGITLTD